MFRKISFEDQLNGRHDTDDVTLKHRFIIEFNVGIFSKYVKNFVHYYISVFIAFRYIRILLWKG